MVPLLYVIPGDSSMVEVGVYGVRMRADASGAMAVDITTSPSASATIRDVHVGTRDRRVGILDDPPDDRSRTRTEAPPPPALDTTRRRRR
jgi:hypothetical protein